MGKSIVGPHLPKVMGGGVKLAAAKTLMSAALILVRIGVSFLQAQMSYVATVRWWEALKAYLRI